MSGFIVLRRVTRIFSKLSIGYFPATLILTLSILLAIVAGQFPLSIFNPAAGAAETSPAGCWDNLSHIPGDEIEPPVDGNLQCISLHWGIAPFSGAETAVYPVMSWWFGAGKDGGAWTDTGWQALATDEEPASLWIEIDRAALPGNLLMVLIGTASADADIQLDLLDAAGDVVASAIHGNIAAAEGGLNGQTFFPLPLENHPQASVIRLSRRAGDCALLLTQLLLDSGAPPDEEAESGETGGSGELLFCPELQVLIDMTAPSWLNEGIAGNLLVEVWHGVPGNRVAHLLASPRYPAHPDEHSYVTELQLGSIGDHYGRRVRGTITPSASGNYRFRLAGDDESELWLSNDDTPHNIKRIAHVPGWTGPDEFDKYPSQLSPQIFMDAAVPRYIEVLQKEHAGGDHVSVQWSLDGGPWSVIGAEHIHSFVQPRVWEIDIWQAYRGQRNEIWHWEATEDRLDEAGIIDEGWIFSDGALHALGLRGEVTLSLPVPAGIHAVEVEGRASTSRTASSASFDIEVLADGLSLGRGSIVAGTTQSGSALFYLPRHEEAGDVIITVRLLDIDPNHHLALTAVRLLSFDGGDWQTRRIQDSSGDYLIPGYSYISPAFIEGRARWIERLTLLAGDEILMPVRGPGHVWYADVPLCSVSPVSMLAADAESGITREHEIEWRAWDLSRETPEDDVLVRIGDAMRFTSPGSLTLKVNGDSLDNDAPLSHRESGLADGLYRYRLRGIFAGGHGEWTAMDAVCEVEQTASTGKVVDSFWGGNLVGGNRNLRGAQTGFTGDFNDDGNSDYCRMRAFDETTPLDPGVSMPGKSTRYYGGVRATYYGTSTDRTFSRFMVRNVAADPVQICTDLSHSGEKSLHGAVVWLAEDFLLVDDLEYATFDRPGNLMTLSVATDNGSVTPAFRFLVKSNGQYYVSRYRANPYEGTSATFHVLNDPSTASWAEYDPVADLAFDADSASFRSIEFGAIEAVGYMFEMERSEVPINFRNHGFSVNATITSCIPAGGQIDGLSVPIRSSTGNFSVGWERIADAAGYELQRSSYNDDEEEWGEWQTVSVSNDDPHSVVFDEEGTYVVTGEWDHEGVASSGALVVRAVSSSFNPHTALWVNRPRNWVNPGLAPEVHVQCDQGLRLHEQEPPPVDVRSFNIDAFRTGKYIVIGRLGGPEGPVLCRTVVPVFDLLSTNQTGIAATGEVLADGSRIVAMPVSAADLPDGALIRLRIFVAGVTFEDGSTEMWISAGDLDSNGMITVRFIYPENQPTSVCHTLEIWQGGEIIATR